MPTSTPLTLFDLVLFPLVGLGIEVIFTALADREKHLVGYSSMLYIPVYALVPIGFAVAPGPLLDSSWIVRILLYPLIGHGAEYVGMGTLRLLFGKSPTEESYRRSRWNIHGLTRLDYAPAFIAGGFLFAWIFRVLHALPT